MTKERISLLEATNALKPQFLRIINPLKNFGIANFSYYKVYKDRRAFYICSEDKWNSLHYQSDQGFDGVKRTIKQCLENNIDQVIFSGDPGKVSGKIGKIYGLNEPMNVEKMLDFNLWNSISFYRYSENFFESYNLFGGNDQDGLGDFFESKSQYLTKFLSYFISEFDPLLQCIDKKEWVLLDNIILGNKKFDPTLDCNLITMDGKEVFITEKQLSIIELIHKGNPIKCIEYKLGISAQTVRNYLHRLKGKLSCSTTEDLVRLWHENRK